jgi:hypothetical protein
MAYLEKLYYRGSVLKFLYDSLESREKQSIIDNIFNNSKISF